MSVDELAARLRASLSDSDGALSSLADLVRPCLAWLELLDASDGDHEWAALDHTVSRQRFLSRHLGHCQLALVHSASKKWQSRDAEQAKCIFAALCPACNGAVAAQVAISSRAIILASDIWQKGSLESVRFLLQGLEQLSEHHLLCSAYAASLGDASLLQSYASELLSVPTKIANALGARGWLSDLPESLIRVGYHKRFSIDFERLLSRVALANDENASRTLASILTKVIRHGYFANEIHSSAFWTVVLPIVMSKAVHGTHGLESETWSSTIAQLSAFNQRSFVLSLVSAISKCDVTPSAQAEPSTATLASIKAIGLLLRFVFGTLSDEDSSDVWETFQHALLSSRERSTNLARAVLCWLALCQLSNDRLTSVLMELIEACLPMWSAPEMLAHGDELSHRYLTIVLGLSLTSLPSGLNRLDAFAHSKPFLAAIQAHLGTMRTGIRLRGMLLAELVSERTSPDSPLRFGDEIWDGEDAERQDVRAMRALMNERLDWAMVNAQQQTASSSPASNAPRPVFKKAARPVEAVKAKPMIQEISSTSLDDDDDDLPAYAMPSEATLLQSNDKDLTDVPLKKKPKPPVYISDLSAMLKKTEDADIQAIALGAAASLIKRKAGTRELAENAVDLTIALTGLQDNFDLPLFEEQRLQALTVLAAACPQPVGPCLIEQLFGSQYSLQQRHAILSAVGLAASPPAQLESVFTSLRLQESDTLPQRKELPQRVRALIEPLDGSGSRQIASGSESALVSANTPAAVADAAIMPLLNRFWIYLGDSASVPQVHSAVSPYLGGAGSAIMFEPLILGKFLSTLSLLLEQSFLSPRFVDALAPESLELVLALRSFVEADGEATAAAFEVVIVVLQGLDRLHMLVDFARSHIDLLQRLREWGRSMWRDARLASAPESRLGRATAGVCFSLDEILAKETPARWTMQTQL